MTSSTCDVCGDHCKTITYCSGLMLVSFSYCQECYEACAEPEAVLEHLMDLAHSDINNLHPQLKELLTWKGNDYLPLSSWIKTRTKSVSNCA